MYIVCFMSRRGHYHKRFYGLNIESMLSLISEYRRLVPYILVTDSSGKTIAEIQDGEAKNAGGFAAALEDVSTRMTPKDITESVEVLFLTYQTAVARYIENRSKKVEMMIAEKDLLALAAKDDIDLFSMGYQDIEQTIDKVERPWY